MADTDGRDIGFGDLDENFSEKFRGKTGYESVVVEFSLQSDDLALVMVFGGLEVMVPLLNFIELFVQRLRW